MTCTTLARVLLSVFAVAAFVGSAFIAYSINPQEAHMWGLSFLGGVICASCIFAVAVVSD